MATTAKNTDPIIYHGDYLPKDASNVSYTWDWSKVTDKAALAKRYPDGVTGAADGVIVDVKTTQTEQPAK